MPRLTEYLGAGERPAPQLAMCRCGASTIKPLCDGSHARTGFTDAKDPKRIPDRRDTYAGQQLTVFDNRGICQHSGFCTDRLPSVFRANAEPLVAPSGGRMDEIIRAVRSCPSGALSHAIDGVEARDQVDWHDTRESEIEVTKDGPYRITGKIPLTDADGNPAARNQGSSVEHYAGAGNPRTSRSAAACTGTSASRTLPWQQVMSPPCSSGPAGSQRCGG